MIEFSRPSGRHRMLPGSRSRRWTTVALAALTAVAAGPFTARPVSAGPVRATPAAGVPAGPTAVPDEATAMHLAWKNRRPVEILGERTEMSQTFAQPDGTLRTRTFATPRWVRRAEQWVEADTTLRPDGAVVRPVATTLDLAFSGGGGGPLLTIARDGRSLSMAWPYPLPAPQLTRNVATYPEVLPGVDLRLTAEVDAFTQVLVVKTPAAARDPRLARLQFGLRLGGVAARQDADGFIRATDPQGRTIFASDGASMWDSPAPPPPSARAANAMGPIKVPPADPQPSVIRDIPVLLESDTLTVTPAQDVLTSTGVTFPIFIDPGFNGGKEIWTHVSRKSPTKSYWTDGNRDDMRVGQLWGGSDTDDWRTIVQFDVSKLKGSTIKSAAVLVNVRHTGDCTASPFQLWRTNWIDRNASVTWNSTKDKWWKVLGEVKATANKSSCPKGNDAVKFSQKLVREAFQDAAKNNYSTITLAFRAKSESDKYQWKKLTPDSTYLDIDYNHTPGKPSGLSFGPCYVACVSPAVTSSRRPSLTMKATDPNGGTLRYEYEVYDSAKKVQKAKSGTTVTGVASGSSRAWSLKTDLPDGQYHWRGRACDSYVCGTYSDWFGFKVDNADPASPTVTSAVYPDTGWNGAPGQAAEFVFTPGSSSDGVRNYTYSLNGAPDVPVTPGSGGVGKATIKPTKDLTNVLKVKAIDTAGNVSGGRDYLFKVKPVGDYWIWGLDEATGSTAGAAPVNNRSMTVGGTGVSWADAGKDGASALTFTGAGEATTQSTVFNTLSPSGFSVGAWVRLPAPEPVVDDGAGGDTVPEPAPGDASGDDPDVEQSPPDNSEAEDPTPPLPTGNLTAVSQDGVNTSAFRLGYRADTDLDGDQVNDPAWCFTVAAADTGAPDTVSACTYSYVEPGAWVHLIGIADPIHDRIQLYVNGTPARDGVLAELPGRATWESTGRFAVGRGWTTGAPDQRWVGDIDEVQVAPRVWTEQEIYDKSHVVDGALA